jgi:transketolase
VVRPADGNETSAAYALALLNTGGPTTIALSRQDVPHLRGTSVEAAMRGGYTLEEVALGGREGAPRGDGGGAAGGAADGREDGSPPPSTTATPRLPRLIVVATGSEVSVAVDAARRLGDTQQPGGFVRVVSLLCAEVYERQPPAYRAGVLPDGVPVLAVEAGAVRGWERYAHQVVGVTQFGFSGPSGEVMKKARGSAGEDRREDGREGGMEGVERG